MTYQQKVQDFLAQRHIAVAGVSRNPEKGEAANAILNKLKDQGYNVVAINPNADVVAGEPCYRHLRDVPEPLDGIVIVTTPAAADAIVQECAELGIPRVWMHRSFGDGSVSETAVAFCESHNISVISGGCPMMFCEPVDFPHKCIRWIKSAKGDFKH